METNCSACFNIKCPFRGQTNAATYCMNNEGNKASEQPIEIPLGAKDSELCGFTYTIPNGMEAVIENGKVVVRKKESDDERIRNFLISKMEEVGNVWKEYSAKDIIAWLEKQGEHANFRNKIQVGDYVTRNQDGFLVNLSRLNRVAEKRCEKQGKKKPADRVKPKFKAGDTIVEKDLDECGYGTIKDIKDGRYFFTDGSAMNITEQEGWQLVKNSTNIEQKPILSEEEELSCFESALFTAFSYAWQSYLLGEKVNVEQWAKEESKELLEAAKEELKEQNHAWSEEDEELLDSIIESYKYLLRDYKACHDVDYIPYNSNTVIRNVVDDVNFLKSLKDRVQPKPQQEWSEEDEYCIHQLIVFCENCMIQDSGAKRCAHWLKSLKDRYTWKPSDEQMEVLVWCKPLFADPKTKGILESLINDLKKLM